MSRKKPLSPMMVSAGIAALMTARPELFVPRFCHDCGKTFELGDRRIIIGDRAYHEDTCGPMPSHPEGRARAGKEG